jgi:hypothetical protein
MGTLSPVIIQKETSIKKSIHDFTKILVVKPSSSKKKLNTTKIAEAQIGRDDELVRCKCPYPSLGDAEQSMCLRVALLQDTKIHFFETD